MKTFISLIILSSCLICSQSQAETFSSKDWIWNTDNNNAYYAVTVNDAGHLLGQFCYLLTGNCLYTVGMDISCEQGNEYPALINSDAGSAQVTLVCGDKVAGQTQNVMYMSPFDDVDRLIRDASRIGIAIAMQNEQFKVARFGLAGSTYAIDLMRAAAAIKMERQPHNANLSSEEYY